MRKIGGLDEYCASCGHCVNRTKDVICCVYMADTGKVRGCPPGVGCDRHTKLTGLMPDGRVKYIKKKIEQRDSALTAAAKYKKEQNR